MPAPPDNAAAVRERVTRLLRESPHPLTYEQLARRLGWPLDTARYAANRLAAEGLLEVQIWSAARIREQVDPAFGADRARGAGAGHVLWVADP